MLADIVKIHCLTHRADFPMSRTSRTVVCKEGSEEHLLSDNFPYSGSWIYCCNCQTFFAWEIGRADVSVRQCPFCLSSLNPRLYACDHCAITMLDFDDQTLRKHHAVLSWGMPQPACPGCHRFPSSTPKTHFCQSLQINLATARSVCPFCKIKTEEVVVDGAGIVTAKLDAALADAEARARDAEERSRFAEEATRKEIELRVQAEHKAQEIEKKVTRDLTGAIDPALAKQETEAAKARAEAEARARVEAEQFARTAAFERQEAELRKAEAEARARDAEERAHEIENRRRQAEAEARREAEMRAIAEMQAREIAERLTNNFPNPRAEAVAQRDKVAIALLAGILVALFFALVSIIYSLILLL